MSLTEIINKQDAMRALNLDDALNAIGQLKRELMNKGEATELFGQVRGDGLASAIATIEQGFGDELFYLTLPAAPRTCLLRYKKPSISGWQ